MQKLVSSGLRIGVLGLSLLTLNGCLLPPVDDILGGQRILLLPRDATVAVGARHDLVLAACDREVDRARLARTLFTVGVLTAFGRFDALVALPGALVPGCEPVPFEVLDTSWDGPTPFELSADADVPGLYTLRAIEEGDATLTFTIELEVDGQMETHTVSAEYSARQITEVDAEIACEGSDRENNLVPASTSMRVDMSVASRGESLSSWGYDYLPLESSAGLLESGEDPTILMIETPSSGTFTFSSPDDPTLARQYQVYDASDFDAFSVSFSGETVRSVGDVTEIEASATIDGQLPCRDTARTRLVIETPRICSFLGAEPTVVASLSQTGAARVHALEPGTCRVRGELEGSDLADVLEFEVAPDWQRVDVYALQNLLSEALYSRTEGELFVLGMQTDEESGVESGAIAYFDGSDWARLDPEITSSVHGAWSNGEGRTYFVGDHTVVAYEAEVFTPVITEVESTLHAIWGSAPDDIYVVGDTVMHFDGDQWTTVEIPELLLGDGAGLNFVDVWSSGPDDVYLLSETALLHFDGTAWSDVTPDSATAPNLASIWGSASDNIWISYAPTQTEDVPSPNAPAHWDGSEWNIESDLLGGPIDGLGPDRMVISYANLVQVYDGSQWTTLEPWTTEIDEPLFVSANEIYLLPTAGGLYRITLPE